MAQAPFQQPQPLTPRQYATLRAIEWFVRHHNQPPTQAELSKMIRVRSSQGCRVLIDSLVEKGFISRQKNKWRSIEVLVPSSEAKVLKPIR